MRNALHKRPAEVEIVEFVPKKAKVIDLLSVQFTAEWQDGTHTLTYQFYQEAGSTWRSVKNG